MKTTVTLASWAVLHYQKYQCCSQGQNPKDEAKARTLRPRPRPGPFKAEAKAWTLETKARTLEAKANFKAKYDSQFNANIGLYHTPLT